MSDWPFVVLGGAMVALGVVAMRFRNGVAAFFREMARPLYGDKLVDRVYTGNSMRWPAIGLIVVGGFLVILALLPR